MVNKRLSYNRILKDALYILAAIEICLGAVWFILNILRPVREITESEYLRAMFALNHDSWQSLFYVYFLRGLYVLSGSNLTLFYFFTHLLQAVFLFSALFFLLHTLFKEDKRKALFFSLFIFMFPAVISVTQELSPLSLRAAIAIAVIDFVLKSGKKKRPLIVTVTVIILSLLSFISFKTADDEFTDRTEKSFGYLLFDKTATGHIKGLAFFLGDDMYRAHGDSYDGVDTNPGLMPYTVGNWVFEEYPDRTDREYHYRWLSKYAFSTWKKDTVLSNFSEVVFYTFTPFTPLFIEGLGISGTDTVAFKENFTERMYPISLYYYEFSFAGFLVLFILFVFRDKRNIKLLIISGVVSLVLSVFIWFFTPKGFDVREGIYMTLIYAILFSISAGRETATENELLRDN